MPDSIYFGKTVISLKTVDSTNNYSTELLKQKLGAEGTVIMAEEQTSGRGQRGNTWHTEPGTNLTCTYILSPAFLDLQDNFLLTQVVSLSVVDCLEHITAREFRIKWPNDILYHSRKISGILIETVSANNRISNAVAGIGINVNQSSGLEKFNATSLKLITGENYDLRNTLDLLSFFLEKRYLGLKTGKIKQINEDYLNKMFGLNEWKDYRDSSGQFKGLITGVTSEGLLKLQKEDGVMYTYDLKQISLIS